MNIDDNLIGINIKIFLRFKIYEIFKLNKVDMIIKYYHQINNELDLKNVFKKF